MYKIYVFKSNHDDYTVMMSSECGEKNIGDEMNYANVSWTLIEIILWTPS